MPIDPKKALGAKLRDGEVELDQGPGDPLSPRHRRGRAGHRPRSELEYTYEKNLKVLPSFGVIPVFGAIGRHRQRARARSSTSRCCCTASRTSRSTGRSRPTAKVDEPGRIAGDLRQGQGGARRARGRDARTRPASRSSPTASRSSRAARAASAASPARRPGNEAPTRAAGRRGRVADAAAAGAALPALRRQEPAARGSRLRQDGRLRQADPPRPLLVRHRLQGGRRRACSAATSTQGRALPGALRRRRLPGRDDRHLASGARATDPDRREAQGARHAGDQQRGHHAALRSGAEEGESSMGTQGVRGRRRHDEVREAGLAGVGLPGHGEGGRREGARRRRRSPTTPIEQVAVGYCYGDSTAASAPSTSSASPASPSTT